MVQGRRRLSLVDQEANDGLKIADLVVGRNTAEMLTSGQQRYLDPGIPYVLFCSPILRSSPLFGP
jgi:hypothetical protein